MDLTPHVDRLHHELAVLADGADGDTRAVVDRVVASLASPVRLNLLDALAAAADEITTELAPGSVEVRLRGGEVEFVVTPPPAEAPNDPRPAASPPPMPEDGDATARINLRLPEHLKAGVEQAANAEHVSTNAWLVRLIAAALSPEAHAPAARTRGGRVGQSWQGWVQ